MATSTAVGACAVHRVSRARGRATYGSFLLENGLDPRRAPRVFVRDLPERRAELLAAYPRNEVWSVNVTLEPVPHSNAWIDNTWDVVDVRLEEGSLIIRLWSFRARTHASRPKGFLRGRRRATEEECPSKA